MSATLIQTFFVSLAGGGNVVDGNDQITIAHGICHGGLPRTPDRIFPDRITGIGVVAVDEHTISFKNYHDSDDCATFLVELTHSIQRRAQEPGVVEPTFYWQGLAPCGLKVGGGQPS
jgi:hypothetical protein